MVMVKDDKEVKIGGPVLYNNQVGILESIYEDKVNVRITATNDLHTVPAGELTQASQEEMEKYNQNQSKDVLLNQARNLKKELMEYGLVLEVRQASEAQVKEYKQEKEKAAAAANIGPSGNIVTEVKQEPLEVDKEGAEAFREGQRAAEREQHEQERQQRRQTGVGMAGETQNQGEKTEQTEEEKKQAEEREKQRLEKEKQEKKPEQEKKPK